MKIAIPIILIIFLTNSSCKNESVEEEGKMKSISTLIKDSLDQGIKDLSRATSRLDSILRVDTISTYNSKMKAKKLNTFEELRADSTIDLEIIIEEYEE
ncbi:hypothetical protein CW751_14980 [Brumimicrobium salinarum]|uniref:Uncharacterized protein n=1 Tax=Brumimicrobium salinarum TaxID=2058658 RepID=A0A2I0QYQ4_9FLAO|nr:hypothetical protein [Brumimicrobium salinarum]PKR79464.1 hypothetical protein CW751_14980 [Brumimicrobium salinarum]